MRLDKYLSNMGVGSRKDVHKLLDSGRVAVDGVITSDPARKIDEHNSVITVGGEIIQYKPFVYIMLYKPAGYLSATEDGHGAPVATDLIGEEYSHYKLGPAGRLDKDAEGFLLLTNDGPFVHRIITPEQHIDKKYYVELTKSVSDKDIQAFANGIHLKDGTECQEAKLEYAGEKKAYITIHEGKFHQVKRMFLTIDNPVVYLKRVSIGGVALDETLCKGEYRELTPEETEALGL